MSGLLLLVSTHRALADADSEKPTVPEPPTERRWYGLPMIVSDVASDAVLFLIPPVGLAGMTFGGPIVHWAHGHVGTGFGSLALRTAAGLVSLAIYAQALTCDSCSRSNLLHALIPLVTVQAVDAAALSWERVVAPSHALARHQGLELRIGPTITMLPSGGSLGVAGTF